MELEDFRKKIDSIDREVLSLLSERMALAPEIAKIKQAASEPVLQPERVAEMINSRKRSASDLGLDPDFIEQLFSLIIRESMRLQEK